MGRLAGFLWLALFISFLGWYGWAMVGIGTVLYIIIYAIKCHYDESKERKD